MSTPAQVFGEIYRTKKWGTGSGGGSDPAVCAPYCRLVERLIEERGIRSVLDIGCGDGRVASAIDWHGANYLGIDCALDENHEFLAHGPPLFAQEKADALTCVLPIPHLVHLVLLKEVLQHLPNADVIRLMDRLKDYPLALHCTGYDGAVNSDIAMGETRPVNLALPPFNLPVRDVLTYGGGYLCQLLEKR